MASCCGPSFHFTTTTTTTMPTSRVLTGNCRFSSSGAISRKAKGRKTVVCSAASASSQRATFRSSVNTDLVLREFHAVSFEQYMEDEDRVVDALFPDKKRRQKLNDEEWRIFMLPLEFFFMSVRPVIDMRVVLKEAPKSNVGSSRTVSKILTLEATRWEIRGLDYQVKPSEFDLGIYGSLYRERGGRAPPKLKGQMELSVDLAIPTSLGLIPAAVIETFGRALLSQLLDNMKDRVNTRLLQDYKEYAQQMEARLSSA
ncbi:unnamed protein product [Calypogeia fissa]